MTASSDTSEAALAADEAFGLLGNATRIQILHVLGEANGSLSFSELRDRVGMADSGQFNYHLDKVEGTFVRHTEEGYALRQAGRRVIEAILSGVLTTEPTTESIHIDRPCGYCGAPIEVRVQPGNIEMFCAECPGVYGESHASGAETSAPRGYLGRLAIPPAGFQNRTPAEVYRAAQVWGNLEILSIANAVCPRCSARLDHSVLVCEDHDTTEGDALCGTCGNRYAAMVETRCTNCIFEATGGVGILLYGHPAVQAFKVGHGENLVAPVEGQNPLSDLTEEIRSVDPFEARFTFTYEGESLSLAVDDDLTITEMTE